MFCNIFCRSNEVFEVAEHSAALTPAGDWALQEERDRKVLIAPVSLWCGNNQTLIWTFGVSWLCQMEVAHQVQLPAEHPELALCALCLGEQSCCSSSWPNLGALCVAKSISVTLADGTGTSNTKAAEGAALLLLGKINRDSKAASDWAHTGRRSLKLQRVHILWFHIFTSLPALSSWHWQTNEDLGLEAKIS